MAICPFLSPSLAQEPPKPTSAELYHDLKKLNFLGTALYIAAHPDDENTNLISYLSNAEKARTVYLSMTRGDGGQNLIGPELQELLGVLRTQELLAARKVDGGEQRFTRANDFGYSKNPEETLALWDKEKVLGDVVWAIRSLRPDIIITRFDHRTPGTTHGHHTASAMLALEAFELANDPKAYPEQLAHKGTWQPRRAFYNTSWWRYGSREEFERATRTGFLKLDVGTYYPLLGRSNNEIAALARSQHLCQGFGMLGQRGTSMEYLEPLLGDRPGEDDLFAGIDTSWSRVPGGKAVGEILYEIERNFDFRDPSKHVPQLLRAYELLQQISDGHWREYKGAELKALILGCAGLYLEASADSPSSSGGSRVTLKIEAVNRSSLPMRLKAIEVQGAGTGLKPDLALANNVKEELEIAFLVPRDHPYSSPYWLSRPWNLGNYIVEEQALIGQPQTPAPFVARFVLEIAGTQLSFEKEVIHRYSRNDKGELYEPFVVLPPATAKILGKVQIFPDGEPKEVVVELRTGKDLVSGSLSLAHPQGWEVRPASIPFSIPQKGQRIRLVFSVTPPKEAGEGEISPLISIGDRKYGKELVEINYGHIPKQSVLLPAKAKVVRMDIKKAGEHIGYIMGAGDRVPESLEEIGYRVDPIHVDLIQKGSLDRYDAIVLGIRAYNVIGALKFKQPLLFDYVANGGTMIVQYNTSGRWAEQFENIAPYPLKLSNLRVTDETAKVEIIAPDNPLARFPNRLVDGDFEGWIQERGLYFPVEWSDRFTPVLSMADPGESPLQGSLLVAPYGKGHYIYTGLSFFRELPAGVPGAFKLFANMLSVGKVEPKQ